MIRRLSLSALILLLTMITLTACDGGVAPTATLRGAIVPTRASPTPTNTPRPTNTATPSATATASPTDTATATDTVTPTASDTVTATATDTVTPTDTATATDTPSATPTDTPTETPSPQPTASVLAIAFGIPTQGEIVDEPVVYEFAGEAGQVVSIQMQRVTADLDPVLQFTDATGRVLAENDDASLAQRDSFIRSVTIPADGTYRIIANRFGSNSGAYTLTLTLISGGSSATPSPRGEGRLNYGDTVEGTIDQQTPARIYLFEGRAGDVVNIRLNRVSGSLDPLLILEDARRVRITSNDDVNTVNNRNSHIRDFALPADGEYRIVATRYQREQGSSEGGFELSLEGSPAANNNNNNESGEAPASPSGSPEGDGRDRLDVDVEGSVRVGDQINGEITDANINVVYRLDADPGDVVTLSIRQAEGSNLDPLLLLVGPNGREVARNDDTSTRNRDSMIDNIVIVAGGPHYVVVRPSRRRTGTTRGAYILAASEGRSNPTIVATLARPLEFGETVTISLDNRLNGDAIFSIQADAADTITVSLEEVSGNLQANYAVINPLTGEILLQGGADNTVTLPDSGFYSIVFQQQRGTGSFTLTVTRDS